MSGTPKIERPEPGSVTVREVRQDICTHCGRVIDEDTACSVGCPFDTEPRTLDDYIVAVYEVTERFLRDERPGVKA